MRELIKSFTKPAARFFASKPIPIKIIWSVAMPAVFFIITLTVVQEFTKTEVYLNDDGEWDGGESYPFSLSETWWIWCGLIASIGWMETIIWSNE